MGGDRRRVVQLGGLEPPASGSTDRRSNQLSYSCTECENGLALRPEPRSQPGLWQAWYAQPGHSPGPSQLGRRTPKHPAINIRRWP